MSEATIRDLIEEARERGASSPREVAQSILDEHGPEVFALLTRPEQETLLTRTIRYALGHSRNATVRGDRVTSKGDIPRIRIAAAGPGYWGGLGDASSEESGKEK
ncbi:hypothetical protein BH18ACT14_BH18ACT14_12410 [soil metagenome]